MYLLSSIIEYLNVRISLMHDINIFYHFNSEIIYQTYRLLKNYLII